LTRSGAFSSLVRLVRILGLFSGLYRRIFFWEYVPAQNPSPGRSSEESLGQTSRSRCCSRSCVAKPFLGDEVARRGSKLLVEGVHQHLNARVHPHLLPQPPGHINPLLKAAVTWDVNHLPLRLVSAAWAWPLISCMSLPYIDKSEENFLRAVFMSQLIPDGEEATQRWSGVGARQDHLNSRFLEPDRSAVEREKGQVW